MLYVVVVRNEIEVLHQPNSYDVVTVGMKSMREQLTLSVYFYL